MDWYILNTEYVNYLRQFDNRVAYIDYEDKFKPYIGIVLSIDQYNYYVPISSAKPKHENMKNGLTFHKIKDGEHLLAVLNLGNMIPVPKSCLCALRYNQIGNFRPFKSEEERTNYIHLLQHEKAIIDEMEKTLQRKAAKLHEKYLRYPNSDFLRNCVNFKLLEEKSLEYEASNKH